MTLHPLQSILHTRGKKGSVFWLFFFFLINSHHWFWSFTIWGGSTEAHSGVSGSLWSSLHLLSGTVFPDTSSASAPQSHRPSSSKPLCVPFLLLHKDNPARPWDLNVLGLSPPCPQRSDTLLYGFQSLHASPLCQSHNFASTCTINFNRATVLH